MLNKSHAVFLRGGMGNQFFQWIYALHLMEQGNAVTLDDSFLRPINGNQAAGTFELNKVFKTLYMPITSRLRHIKQTEPLFVRLAHSAGLLNIEGRRQLLPGKARLHYGYYQSPAYWTATVCRKVFDSVRPDFRPRAYPTFPHSLRMRKYAAIHIRGGDYKKLGYNISELGLLTQDYYARAIESPVVAGLPIVVVSDDDQRARRIIEALAPCGREVLHLTDLVASASDPMLALSIILSADSLICANSSFSAMGGYLNPIAQVSRPSPWFRGSSLSNISPARPQWLSVASTFELGSE